jgi:hypothetical protein
MQDLTISYEDTVAVNLDFATTVLSPPTGLAAAAVVGGGAFAAGTYFWEVTALTAIGETTVSNEASAVIALNGSANLTWNAPNGPVTGYRVYRGTASGAENVLVTTIVGNTTNFTDTNVGAAGNPPVANGAVLPDYVLITGYCKFYGYSVSETSGANPVWLEIVDNTNRLAEARISAGGSETENLFRGGVPINGYIRVHVNSGMARGTIYAGIPPVNC